LEDEMKTMVLMLIGLAAVTPAAISGAGGAVPEAAAGTLRFTILYDNYLFKEGTTPDWGFSCLIEGTEKTILFDTGTKPEILLHNVETCGVDLKKVELIVISHNHGDHTGGLPAVLAKNPRVTVFYPVSFPAEFGTQVRAAGAETRAVDKPVEICRDVFLTGELGDAIKEQSLILRAPGGSVVVTGCSHPGIVGILKRAREVVPGPIDLVFGGFHLNAATPAEMDTILAGFRSLEIRRCGATHCTGDAQIAMFKKAYGENYLPLGTGRVFEVPLR
jgi:7,8-dihydropterin-6-yl-methyl-4-(beta-D-ribofuranosyl)aminobenzene 5'-phosphate synthase